MSEVKFSMWEMTAAARILPKRDLLVALQHGPQSAVPPRLHKQTKDDLASCITRVIKAGGDAGAAMAQAVYQARLDRDVAIVRGERRR